MRSTLKYDIIVPKGFFVGIADEKENCIYFWRRSF